MGGIVDSIFGGGQAKAIKQGTKAQVQAQREANAILQKQYDTTRADLAPYRDAGVPALSAYKDYLGLNGAEGGQRFLDMFKLASPEYGWGLNQGIQALDRSAAARGRLNSGAQGMALTQFGQDYGLQQLGNYGSKMIGLAGLGQNAAAMTGNLGSQMAGQIASGTANIGSIQSAGLIGAANARAQGLNNVLGLAGNIIGFGSTGGRNWFGLG